MKIDISEIRIDERVRKEFGNLQELAEDIQKNGLIEPIAVSLEKPHILLAGERRLRAVQMLGWKEIDVHPLPITDELHKSRIELSENELREKFTMTEMLDYARKLKRLEEEAARRRMAVNSKDRDGSPNLDEHKGRTDDIVAKKVGIGGRTTLAKARFIEDNKALLTSTEFADWNNKRLSIDAVYKLVKDRSNALQKEHETHGVHSQAYILKQISTACNSYSEKCSFNEMDFETIGRLSEKNRKELSEKMKDVIRISERILETIA